MLISEGSVSISGGSFSISEGKMRWIEGYRQASIAEFYRWLGHFRDPGSVYATV